LNLRDRRRPSVDDLIDSGHLRRKPLRIARDPFDQGIVGPRDAVILVEHDRANFGIPKDFKPLTLSIIRDALEVAGLEVIRVALNFLDQPRPASKLYETPRFDCRLRPLHHLLLLGALLKDRQPDHITLGVIAVSLTKGRSRFAVYLPYTRKPISILSTKSLF
jgi:hypothetical protein